MTTISLHNQTIIITGSTTGIGKSTAIEAATITTNTNNMTTISLHNQTIIITGSTTGIGKSTAIEAAKAGAKVIITGRRAELGQTVVDHINNNGGEATFIQADITVESEIETLFSNTAEIYGSIDGVVINAGSYRKHVLGSEGSASETWNNLHDINARSQYITLHYAFKHMKENTGGSIVLVSSIVADTALPVFGDNGLYASTKASNRILGKTAANDGAPYGIRVNTVLPGFIATDIYGGATAEQLYGVFGDMTLLKKIGTPEEIAKPIVFLLSDWASYITGADLVIDGGVLNRV
eukprot:TRINITY_DN12345_c0_g1_i1.p1 TRINITY_DN12345_c0_g1~~TRINITY_DN12345_c0_g1_i1.p1  ORF type:complete len:310 (+),score=76.63 TRINITY_DN12345_c0_g1_i1:47-931(+)